MANSSFRGSARRQQGVSLIIALIILVALMLGGIAMMRSVDTTVLVAGNLAFRNSAVNSSDLGSREALRWLNSVADRTVSDNTNDTATSNGYFNSYSAAVDPLISPAIWNNARCLAADSAGNTVCYVINRMCDAGSGTCATYRTSATGTGSGGSLTGDEAATTTATGIYYRVTARITGPRNTQAMIQTTLALGS